MNSRPHFQAAKLPTFRQLFISACEGQDEAIITKLTQATSVGELWKLLFENALFEISLDLITEGMVPTAEELALLDPVTYTNSWYLLTTKDPYHIVFKTLLEKNIGLIADDLSPIHSSDEVNVWYWLARSEQGIEIIINLLEKSKFPKSPHLSVVHPTNHDHAWHFFFGDKKRDQIFETLIKANVLPENKDLSNDFWNKLIQYASENPDGQKIIKELVTRKVLPPQEVLLNQLTFWFLLAYQNIQLLEQLIDENRLPSVEDLNTVIFRCDDDRFRSNAWYGLVRSRENYTVVKKLIDKGIVPNAKALSVIPFAEPSGWYWLTYHNEGIDILDNLLELGIQPSTENLSIRCTNGWRYNSWDNLADPEKYIDKRCKVFMKLLNLGIIPSVADLGISDKTVWHKLINWDGGKLVFKKLIELNVLPMQETLTFRKKYYWDSEPSLFREISSAFSKTDDSWIVDKLRAMIRLKNEFNIAPDIKSNAENLMINLLSSKNFSDYYGYLWFFYTATARFRKDFRLPEDCVIKIGEELLPEGVLACLKNGLQNQQDPDRETFIKYHSITLFNSYTKDSFHSNDKLPRVKSIIEALKTSSTPSHLIINQCKMFYKPGLTKYLNGDKEYQKPFNKTNGTRFESTLKEMCMLKKW
jgi:hypothetical protein